MSDSLNALTTKAEPSGNFRNRCRLLSDLFENGSPRPRLSGAPSSPLTFGRKCSNRRGRDGKKILEGHDCSVRLICQHTVDLTILRLQGDKLTIRDGGETASSGLVTDWNVS